MFYLVRVLFNCSRGNYVYTCLYYLLLINLLEGHCCIDRCTVRIGKSCRLNVIGFSVLLGHVDLLRQ